ncbi:MAG TPA: lipocalin-like domain-containing protein [Blastocatellia bacterium]|nr:lipocalin-like domain-containing protein [Blastocatellia bacterium]
MMKSQKTRTQWLIAVGCLLFAAINCLPAAYGLLSAETAEQKTRLVNKDGWREAEAGYRYEFPQDHASHEDYAVEWWYYTGNIETKEGRRFGYQLTFFRIGVVREPLNTSRWALRNLYMAHFAISDIEQKEFHSFERINRAGIGWAGAESSSYRVWNEDWEARLDGRDHLLRARGGDYELDLRLALQKPEVIHGENGISQKGSAAGNASHYYSLTRLQTRGQIKVGGQSFEVTGLSWMDHEFGTSFLEEEQTGWDWFSIQLDDGRDLMMFQIRRRDGSIDPRSSGTLIDTDGRAVHIPFSDFALASSDVWRSAESGASYPINWTIDLPRYDLRLSVKAAFDDQELRTTESTGVTYWEGSVKVDGTAGDKKIAGRGYLEMTGYSGQNMGAILH